MLAQQTFTPAELLGRLLSEAAEAKASDVHLMAGQSPALRVDGRLKRLDAFGPLAPEDVASMLRVMVDDQEELSRFERDSELDFRFALPGVGQFRGNAARQQGTVKISLRLLPLAVPSLDALGLPPMLKHLVAAKGLVLVCGATGSGKSTTLAAMLDHINRRQERVIVTIEDPIEYVHESDRSLVMQREVGEDTRGFGPALRHVLRQDPDVVMVGEMRDLESIALAVTAAETGHLVLSSLHANSAVEAIDRIVDIFPFGERQQVRTQLSMSLAAVVYQVLLPRASGKGRTACCEMLLATPAVRHLIREGKTHEIMTYVQTGRAFGMQTLDQAIRDAKERGLVAHDLEAGYGKASKDLALVPAA